MTLSRPAATAVILCAALVAPGVVGAASLSPLDNFGASGALAGLDQVPGLPGAPFADPPSATPALSGPAPFKFVDDTGLDANPLRSVLPENQWANPQAAGNSLIQRR